MKLTPVLVIVSGDLVLVLRKKLTIAASSA